MALQPLEDYYQLSGLDSKNLPKNTQRGTYEPFIFITSIVAVISFAVAGLYTIQMAYDLLKILPALIIGSWLGVKIYHVLDGEVFRRTILGLILAAGIVLLI